MTFQPQPESHDDDNPPRADQDDQSNGDRSVSIARLTMISTLGAAVITGIVTIVTQFGPSLSSDTDAAENKPSGISYDYTADYAKSEVTVNGSATGDVDEVAVLVGPRPFGGKYWGETAKVVGGTWDVTVKTDPDLPKQYVIQAIPHFGRHISALGANTIELYSFGTGDDSEGSGDTSRQQDPLQCAVQNGAICFDGPEWGTPVIRQSGN
jgi:hypothetical protein